MKDKRDFDMLQDLQGNVSENEYNTDSSNGSYKRFRMANMMHDMEQLNSGHSMAGIGVCPLTSSP